MDLCQRTVSTSPTLRVGEVLLATPAIVCCHRQTDLSQPGGGKVGDQGATACHRWAWVKKVPRRSAFFRTECMATKEFRTRLPKHHNWRVADTRTSTFTALCPHTNRFEIIPYKRPRITEAVRRILPPPQSTIIPP